jgi:hypothetical protein
MTLLNRGKHQLSQEGEKEINQCRSRRSSAARAVNVAPQDRQDRGADKA